MDAVVDERYPRHRRAIADHAVQGAHADDAVLAGETREPVLAQLQLLVEPDKMRQPVRQHHHAVERAGSVAQRPRELDHPFLGDPVAQRSADVEPGFALRVGMRTKDVSVLERQPGHRFGRGARHQRTVAVEHCRTAHPGLQGIVRQQPMQLCLVRFRDVALGYLRREPGENGIRRRCIVIEARHQDLRDALGLAVELALGGPLEVRPCEHAQRQHERGKAHAYERGRGT